MSDKMTREEAIDVLKHNYPSACFTDLCEAVEIAIQALSAQPERKKGKWIISSKFDDCYYAKCDVCNIKQVFYGNKPVTNFCPNCGADMRGENDD